MRIGEAKNPGPRRGSAQARHEPYPQQASIGRCTDPSCDGAMKKTTSQDACAWCGKPAMAICDKCQVYVCTACLESMGTRDGKHPPRATQHAPPSKDRVDTTADRRTTEELTSILRVLRGFLVQLLRQGEIIHRAGTEEEEPGGGIKAKQWGTWTDRPKIAAKQCRPMDEEASRRSAAKGERHAYGQPG